MIPALRRQKPEDYYKLEAGLGYRVNFTWQDFVSQQNKTKTRRKGGKDKYLKTARLWLPFTTEALNCATDSLELHRMEVMKFLKHKRWTISSGPERQIPNALSSVERSFYCLGALTWEWIRRARKLDSTPSKTEEP